MGVKENIIRVRQERGLSQINLAEKTTKLNQSQIAKIEKGKRRISVEDLADIAFALGVPVEDLLSQNS